MGGDGPALVCRADGDSSIGTGHVMRALAVAEAWRGRGGRVRFLSYCPAPALRERIAAVAELDLLPAQPPPPEDLSRLLAVLETMPDADSVCVLLDGYQFDVAYQRALRGRARRTLLVDDFVHLPAYDVDLLLNQNLGAEELVYPASSSTRLLLGPRYALLRGEFSPWRSWTRSIPPRVRRILLTLGGADPSDRSSLLLRALVRLADPSLEVTVCVGAAYRFRERLERLAAEAPFSVDLVTGAKMPEVMAAADLALSGAGSTCWELCFMGLPALLVVLADNQQGIATHLDRAGICRSLGWHESLTEEAVGKALADVVEDAEQRKAMSDKGRALVDGQGCARVIEALVAR